MAHRPHDLAPEVLAFLEERHLATLTTMRADGSPHVTPVGFTWDAAGGLARIITSAGSRKALHVAADPRVSVCQVDRGRWLSLEGVARVSDDPDEVAEAVERYARRYQAPRPNPQRVAVLIEVRRVMGRATQPSAPPAAPVPGPSNRG